MSPFRCFSICIFQVAAFGIASAVPAHAGSLPNLPSATAGSPSIVIHVCEPNCLGAPLFTHENNRPEDETGNSDFVLPQSEGSPRSTMDNRVPPEDSAAAAGDGLFNPEPSVAAPEQNPDDPFAGLVIPPPQ
jgi:hypothetical protein